MNISEDGENNAILLAISLIVQGYRTESELSDLLANISTDIRQDGELNSSSLGSLLINDARLFNLPLIRKNIEDRYSNLGMTVTIPNFEKYIEMFITNSTFQITNKISYPRTNNGLLNLLYDSTFVANNDKCCIASFLPNGTSIKVVCKIKYSDTPLTKAFGLFNGASQGWEIVNKNDSLVLSANGIGQIVSVPAMYSGPPKSISVTYSIYENNSKTPTRIKTVGN